MHDHLRAAVGLRLQQHRIEIRPRRKAGRPRLHRLRPPDLAPSAQAVALFDMFCGLNGATRMPRRFAARHSPATTTDFPASDAVPRIITDRAPMFPP